MGAHRLEADPLPYQINCKIGKTDYFECVQRCKAEKLTPASLMRRALKLYLQQQRDRASAVSYVGLSAHCQKRQDS